MFRTPFASIIRSIINCTVIQCTYTNQDSTVYHTPRLCLLFLGYKPVQHVTVLNTVGNNTIVPPSYMRSVVDRNVVMRRMTVQHKSHMTSQRMTHLSAMTRWRLTASKPWHGLQTPESKTRHWHPQDRYCVWKFTSFARLCKRHERSINTEQWISYKYYYLSLSKHSHYRDQSIYEGWNFNSGIYLFTTDTK